VISRNLRHLRILLAVADTGSITQAAEMCHVSQPAVTQAINKLEREACGALFERTRQGLFATPRGAVVADRVRRAFALLDPAAEDVSPRLRITATSAQLAALVAVREAENFTLAARRLGIAQPTVHRAVTQLEQEAARALFERTSYGLSATRQCRALTRATQLAFAELAQADADLAELEGKEVGQIVIGALPLSRSVVLPRALAEFRRQRPTQAITVIDGLYSELLSGLRRGDIDVIVGALRDPAPIEDVRQERLFDDTLCILSRNGHPLAARARLSLEDLHRSAWVVPREGTPARMQFDRLFEDLGPPASIIEAGSILLMREILCNSDHLGCISRAQAEAEISRGLLTRLDFQRHWTGRPIGLTTRQGWQPTQAQALLVETIRDAAARMKLGL
jgi:LysR family transcriptional regulator, regulator for genes of the gallate degradation pathway